MIGKVADAAIKITQRISEGRQQKREAELKATSMRHDYLKEQMTSFVFTSAALTFIIPVGFWILSPILKNIPFMTEVLNDYEKIINTIGMERIFWIVSSLLGVGGFTKGASLLGKIKMAVKKEDNETAIKKEKIVRGIIGDDYVSLTAKEDAPKKVKEFVKKFASKAIEVEKKFGIPADGVLAHAALETGYGKHILIAYDKDQNKIQTNNIFNIKASSSWKGSKAWRKVWEVAKDGSDTTEYSAFRVYSDYSQSFEDYGNLLTTLDRYRPVLEAADSNEFAEKLHECGYQTDTKAPEKIKKIIQKYFNYDT
jgi:flagellum-specific peptidoglycan hydrolase FlgJ